MDCCPSVSSVHGILQARILSISFSRVKWISYYGTQWNKHLKNTEVELWKLRGVIKSEEKQKPRILNSTPCPVFITLNKWWLFSKCAHGGGGVRRRERKLMDSSWGLRDSKRTKALKSRVSLVTSTEVQGTVSRGRNSPQPSEKTEAIRTATCFRAACWSELPASSAPCCLVKVHASVHSNLSFFG